MFINNMEAEIAKVTNSTTHKDNGKRILIKTYKLYSQGEYGRHSDIEVSTYNDRSAFFRWRNDEGEFAVNLYNFGTYVDLGKGEAKFVHKPNGFSKNIPVLYSEYLEGRIRIVIKDSSNSAGICFMVLDISQSRLRDWGLNIEVYYTYTLVEEKRRTPNAFWTVCEKIFELHVQRNTKPNLSEFRNPANFYKPKFIASPNYSEKDRNQVGNEVFYLTELLSLEQSFGMYTCEEWTINFVSSTEIAFRNIVEEWEFILPCGIDKYTHTGPYISEHKFNKYGDLEIIIIGKDEIDGQKMLEMVKINMSNKTVKFCHPLRTIWCTLAPQSYKDNKLWQAVEHWYRRTLSIINNKTVFLPLRILNI
jgi:hypothetical protein